MQFQWHKLINKVIFWLLAEIILNLVGLDNMADYSEFLLTERITPPKVPLQVVSVTI